MTLLITPKGVRMRGYPIRELDALHDGELFAVQNQTLTAEDSGISFETDRKKVDLGGPTTFNRARISEEFDRVRKFELRYKEGDEWRTFARGSKIGPDYSNQFESVTARHVRLNSLNASDAPTVWEFQLFAPRE